jgi:ribosomal RNA-processing protein 12
MLLLIALVPVLPKTRLHLIPTLVTEAVLGTKEVNEKARNAAFDLLVVMAKKMSEGGVVDQQLLKGDDADVEKDDEGMDTAAPAGNGKSQEGLPDLTFALTLQSRFAATASVEEYTTMVAAGLAASTPHMISATITALSRLMFEFQGQLQGTSVARPERV